MKTSTSQLELASLVMIAMSVGFLSMQAATNTFETVPASLRQATIANPDQALSDSTLQILQLAQSGIAEKAVLSCIENSAAFNLTADHIIYLNNLGVSIRALNAMLAHDREIYSRARASVITNHFTTVRNTPATASRTFLSSDSLNPLNARQPLGPTPAPMDNQSAGPLPLASGVAAQSHAGLQVAVEKAMPAATNTRPALPLPTARKASVLYPVRESYPVELTTPIVFLDCPTF